MEPLFINRFTMTKDDFKEFVRAGGRYVVQFILLAAVFGACAMLVFINGESPWLFLVPVLLGALIIWRYFDSVNRLWAGVCEQAHGEPKEKTLTFTEECAYKGEEPSEETTIDYFSIKRVVTTKRLIILVTRARLGYILRRGAFVKGSEEDFLQFIKAKIALNKLD